MNREHSGTEAPGLSVIIPAWNEADYLPETLAALRAAVADLAIVAEVIVVDNASDDSTAAVARASGARVIIERERRIARVRNAGADAARAPWLLFLDADTRVNAALMAAMLRCLHDGWAGGGAVVALDVDVGGAYAAGLRLWNALSRRFRLAAGCFLFARADLHRAMGGFDERVYAGEELTYSRRMARAGRQHGRRFDILGGAPVVTSARKADWFSPWQHVLVVLTFLVFPWAGRFRRLAWFWYRRPGGSGE